MPVTQFNMKYVEQAGLVKFDFLGLKTLTVLARAVDLIVADGTAMDLSTIPLDDQKTYEMLSRGETVGVFQLESSGLRRSEEHTSELQSLMRISYAAFCWQKNRQRNSDGRTG